MKGGRRSESLRSGIYPQLRGLPMQVITSAAHLGHTHWGIEGYSNDSDSVWAACTSPVTHKISPFCFSTLSCLAEG